MKKKLEKYYRHLSEIKRLSSTLALLQWDQETKMPVANSSYRSQQVSQLSALIHEKSISKSYQSVVDELYIEKENLNPVERRSVEFSKKELDKSVKLPTKFVEEYSEVKSLAHSKWVEAKNKEDFEIFKTSLRKIIDLTKEYATYIDDSKPIYDVLLDDYEEGITAEDVKKAFDPLGESLKDMIVDITANQEDGSKVDAFKSIEYDEDKVEKLIIAMVRQIGFDFESGAVGRVHHPFETTLSPKDVRINMSYHHKDLSATITGAIHELGHGLYEQNVDSKYHKTSLSQGVSLGIHESQSRLLENMIGRSESFWQYFAPIIRSHFSEGENGYHELKVDEILRQLNYVKPSLIRIEADEVTYNLHIIIRFEIELMMLQDDFDLSDLPELWNSKYKEYLGIKPDKLSNGVLQDVHWSLGALGYFPTYTLGNIIAGQLWDSFTKEHGDWSDLIIKGDFNQYFNWFNEKVWRHGSFYKTGDLLNRIVGESLNSDYLRSYLRNKYSG